MRNSYKSEREQPTCDGWVASAGLWTLSVLAMTLLAMRQEVAIALMIVVPLLLGRAGRRFICGLLFVIAAKFTCDALSVTSQGYEDYDFRPVWLVREAVTVTLFFTWYWIGIHAFHPGYFSRWSNKWLCVMAATIVVLRWALGASIYFGGVDNAQALVYLLVFLILVRNRRDLSSAVALLGVLALNAPMTSSFSVIVCIAMIVIFLSTRLSTAERNIPWRMPFVAGIGFLAIASVFAYVVHLRGVRANGEGNNGYTRSILALRSYQVIEDNWVYGTPLGRGILPTDMFYSLGWLQYVSDSADSKFDSYAVSYHNGVLYLFARFGLFAIAFLVALLYFVPPRGPIAFVVMTLVFLLAISANVVIESIRAGPGVGLALGTLCGVFQRKRVFKDERQSLLTPNTYDWSPQRA